MSDRVAQDCQEVILNPDVFPVTERNLAQKYLDLWEQHGILYNERIELDVQLSKLKEELKVMEQDRDYFQTVYAGVRDAHDALADEVAEMEEMTLHFDYCVLPGNHEGECKAHTVVEPEPKFFHNIQVIEWPGPDGLTDE